MYESSVHKNKKNSTLRDELKILHKYVPIEKFEQN